MMLQLRKFDSWRSGRRKRRNKDIVLGSDKSLRLFFLTAEQKNISKYIEHSLLVSEVLGYYGKVAVES